MCAMEINYPEEIKKITDKLINAGFELYLVGGTLRDFLLQKTPKDWDFTTNATPEIIQEVFPESFYDNSFGTVGIPTQEHGVLEITTYRSETGYSNRRHPDAVEWGTTIEEDLKRRDFTMNAIACSVTDGKLVDPYGGAEDVRNQIICAVGDPNERFSEDALRMLRAVRFASQLSFTIDPATLDAIRTNAKLIEHVSGERIRDELLKILASDYAYDGFMLLRNTTLLQAILPEVEKGFGVSQIGPNRHHIFDVGTHNFLALKMTPATDPLVRFAGLLHDVGKPWVLGQDNRGNPTFYNHEVIGAKIARGISDRLHLSKVQREKLSTLIRWHQFSVDDMQTDSAVRRFIRNVGVNNIKDMIDLRIGDRLGSGIEEHNAEGWRLLKFKDRIEKELNPPFAIKDLAVSGTDVMRELNVKPGPIVGQVLQKLFEEVDEDLEKNDREYLLKRIHEILQVVT